MMVLFIGRNMLNDIDAVVSSLRTDSHKTFLSLICKSLYLHVITHPCPSQTTVEVSHEQVITFFVDIGTYPCPNPGVYLGNPC